MSTLTRHPAASYAVFKYVFPNTHEDMELIPLRDQESRTPCHVFSRRHWLKTRKSGRSRPHYHPWCAYTTPIFALIYNLCDSFHWDQENSDRPCEAAYLSESKFRGGPAVSDVMVLAS